MMKEITVYNADLYQTAWDKLLTLRAELEETTDDRADPLKLKQWIIEQVDSYQLSTLALDAHQLQAVVKRSLDYLSQELLVDPIKRTLVKRAVIAGNTAWDKEELDRYIALSKKCSPNTPCLSPLNNELLSPPLSKDYIIANRLIALLSSSFVFPPENIALRPSVESLSISAAEEEIMDSTLKILNHSYKLHADVPCNISSLAEEALNNYSDELEIDSQQELLLFEAEFDHQLKNFQNSLEKAEQRHKQQVEHKKNLHNERITPLRNKGQELRMKADTQQQELEKLQMDEWENKRSLEQLTRDKHKLQNQKTEAENRFIQQEQQCQTLERTNTELSDDLQRIETEMARLVQAGSVQEQQATGQQHTVVELKRKIDLSRSQLGAIQQQISSYAPYTANLRSEIARGNEIIGKQQEYLKALRSKHDELDDRLWDLDN